MELKNKTEKAWVTGKITQIQPTDHYTQLFQPSPLHFTQNCLWKYANCSAYINLHFLLSCIGQLRVNTNYSLNMQSTWTSMKYLSFVVSSRWKFHFTWAQCHQKNTGQVLKISEERLNSVPLDKMSSLSNSYTARHYHTFCDSHIWKQEYPEAK